MLFHEQLVQANLPTCVVRVETVVIPCEFLGSAGDDASERRAELAWKCAQMVVTLGEMGELER
jgi:hypothetical protein